MVGRLAAEVLRRALRTGAIVGIGDGASVAATAAALEEAATPAAVTVVPLCGGYWTTGTEREPYRRVADALDGTGARADGAGPRRRRRHATVARRARRRPGHPRPLGAARRRAVRDRRPDLDRVACRPGRRAPARGAGAIGEVLVAPFDIDGRFVCPALRDRVIAFDAQRLGRVPVAIGVASGARQGPSDPRRAAGRRRPHAGHRRGHRRGRRGARGRWANRHRCRRASSDDGTRAGRPRPRPRHDRGEGRRRVARRPAAGARAARLRTGLATLPRAAPSRTRVRGGRPSWAPFASCEPPTWPTSSRSVRTATVRRSSPPTPAARPPVPRSRSSTRASTARGGRAGTAQRGSAAGRSAGCRRRSGSSGTSLRSPRPRAGTCRPGSGWRSG